MWLQLRGETDLIDEDYVLGRFRALKQSAGFSGIFRALFESTVFWEYPMAYEREGRLKVFKKAQSGHPSKIEESTEPEPELLVPEQGPSRKE